MNRTTNGEQVFMSPNNAELCVGIPLFQKYRVVSAYGIYATFDADHPTAYVLDFCTFAQVVSAEWAHEYLILLGEL